MKDRENLSAGTRAEQLLKEILIVLDSINEKLDNQNKAPIIASKPREDVKKRGVK